MRIPHQLLAAACFCLPILTLPPASRAQTRSWPAHDCGNGAQLRLSSSSGRQGDLLELEFKAPAPATNVTGAWNEKPLEFWPDSSNPLIHRALFGIDLELHSGKYALTLDATDANRPNSPPLHCSLDINVADGHFAIEKLQVNQKFVELNPDDAQRAEAEQQHLRDLFATASPDRLWRGRFRMPLDGAHTGVNFGRRRILNGEPRSPHAGLDLPAPAGTRVHAAQRGRVAFAGELFFSGNTVIIDHGLGLYTFYGHLQSIDVKEGDLLDTGALLGRVGSTGRATGPHLHWGMYINAARVNPLEILRLPTS